MLIMIADDEEKVRSALRLLIEHEEGLEVVGEAGDMQTLMEKIDSCRPDLILLDWELPGFQPAEHLANLHHAKPALRVIALSGRFPAHETLVKSGVDAFVSKGDPPESVLSAIRKYKRNDWNGCL
jgi:two-component system, NarL family, invasion response regulator UvrY